MKKLLCILIITALLLSLTGCIKTKTLHCDGCGTEVIVKEGSNMEEDWLIYCEACNEELFGDDEIIGNN